MIALATALLLAATPAAKIDYQGPLGLKWGMSPEAVKEALSKRLEFVREQDRDGGVSLAQDYSGTFADFAAEEIEVIFWEGKLLSVAVTIAPEEERPVDLLWQQVVASMSVSYGPANKVNDPLRIGPASKKDGRSPTMLRRLMERSEIERAILSREAHQTANWTFRNKAKCGVAIYGAPTATSLDEFRVLWLFADGTRLEAWDAATDKARPPDF
jgi:hypothetical protein